MPTFDQSVASRLAVGEVLGETSEGVAGPVDLSGAFPSVTQLRQTARVGGPYVAWLGDSHLDGSGATNAGNTSMRALVPRMAGTTKVAGVNATIDAAVGGDSSAMVLARVPAVLAQSPQMVFLMCGSNDAINASTLATYKTNIAAIVTLCQQAGVPIVIGTPPPFASGVASAAARITLIREYVLWLKLWGPTVGVPIVDVFGAVVDATTGYMSATYNSGDHVHLNDAGHRAAAVAIAATLGPFSGGSALPAESWLAVAPAPTGAEITGLVSNPLMVGTGPPTNWIDWGGIGGRIDVSGVTFTTSAKDGALPVGQWANMRLNAAGAAAAGGQRAMTRSLTASAFTAGDVLLMVGYLKSNDPSSIATGATFKLFNGSTGAALTSNDSFGTNTPGPILKTYTVGVGVTSILVGLLASVTAAQNITTSIGAVDVFNLTQMGLTEFSF